MKSEQHKLVEKAEHWIANDPDAQTRLEMRQLLAQATESNDFSLLKERFSHTLTFGTAGLRALQGAGPSRINSVVTAQAAFALSRFLLENDRGNKVVIGYDGRYNSQAWAENTARIVSGHGLSALLMPQPLPTPLLAFAVRHLNASAGVMVTASHNPREYNGYKVYLGGKDQGAQITSPEDSQVARYLAEAPPYSEIPVCDEFTILEKRIIDDYLSLTLQAVINQTGWLAAAAERPKIATTESSNSKTKTRDKQTASQANLSICHTAMHGVSDELFTRLMHKAGFEKLVPVKAQQKPDPAFPTLPFPNPEEKGALDLAFETAKYHKCDLILANDPDADRLAVAETNGRIFTGNEIGAILGWEIARRSQGGTLANSMVSSPCLRKVAEQYGLNYAETPTGFKWVVRVPQVCFGFEEALGYMPYPQQVRDKDGISAALTIAAIAARLKQEGRKLTDYLEEFKQRFGYFASGQYAIRTDSNEKITGLMEKIRAKPWRTIGQAKVTAYQDLMQAKTPVDMLKFQLGDTGRVIVRPSGTEPKLKCYLDSIGDSEEQAQSRLLAISRGCQQALDSDAACTA